jgi:hypothetical protein
MKQFTKINNTLTKEDFIYSEITALAYMNPEFFQFLNDERWKYLTDNSVLNNSITFELQKWNIELQDKEHLNICIEEHWDYLKDTYKVALELKSKFPTSSKIIVSERILNFIIGDDTIIFRDKIIADMITLLDIEKCLGVETVKLYNVNIDTFVKLYITHITSYLKPEYLIGLEYFLDIFYEKKLETNWFNFKNFKTDGLGYRNDNLPKLYYNNLADYCKDVLVFEQAFRDYSLMLDNWKQIKNDTLNKQYLLPIFKNKITQNNFLFLISKYYSLANKDYYKANKYNDVIHLPSNEEFKNSFIGDYTVSYKTNSDKDLIICIVWGNIEMRIIISLGLSPYEFTYSIDVVENNGYKKLD